MADWNSELYLKFKAERTQPSHDLAARKPFGGARRSVVNWWGPRQTTAALGAR